MNVNDIFNTALHKVQGMLAKGATHSVAKEADDVVEQVLVQGANAARTGSAEEVALAGATRAVDGVAVMREIRRSVVDAGSLGGISKRVREVAERFGEAPVSVSAMKGGAEVPGSRVLVTKSSEISLGSIVHMHLGTKGVSGVLVRDWTPAARNASGAANAAHGGGAAAVDPAAGSLTRGVHISTEPAEIAARYPIAPSTRQATDGVERILITVMDSPKELTMSPEYIRRVLTRRGVDVDILHLRTAKIRDDGHIINSRGRVMENYDAVIARGGAEHRDEHLAILHQLRRNGLEVRNTPEAIAIAGNKARTAEALFEAGVPHPATMEIKAGDDIAATVAAGIQRFDGKGVVLKPVSDKGGAGVVFLEEAPADVMESVAKQLLGRPGTEGVIVQEWMKEGVGRDVRAFIVRNPDGSVDVLPHALKRVAPRGMGAANASTGATLHSHKLSEEEVAMARKAADAIDLDYGGVDFIAGPAGPVVVEVNTSAGTTHIISNMLGKDSSLAHRIADQALGELKHKGPWGPNFLRRWGY